jgi:acylphosphatase
MERRVSAILIVKGKFKNTGFGFSCLQQAEALKIEGTFEYLHEGKVRITVSGSHQSIEEMMSWCKKQEITTKAELRLSAYRPEHYHGFKIVNLLENGKVKNGMLES